MRTGIDRRGFVAGAAAFPLVCEAWAEPGAPGVAPSEADRLADLLGDLGLATNDPLLLLAATRAAARAGRAPDAAWARATHRDGVGSRIVSAVALGSLAAGRHFDMSTRTLTLARGETQEFSIPMYDGRLCFGLRVQSPGYEEQRRLAYLRRAACELSFSGAKLVGQYANGRPAASAPPFLMNLPWVGYLAGTGDTVRVRIRNLRDGTTTAMAVGSADSRR